MRVLAEALESRNDADDDASDEAWLGVSHSVERGLLRIRRPFQLGGTTTAHGGSQWLRHSLALN